MLKNPKIILTEWIPFGKNYMNEFIDRITLKEYQSKRKRYFSVGKGDIRDKGIFEVFEYKTAVNIIEFEPETYVQFTSNVLDEDLSFFISVDYLGRVIYAVELESSSLKKLSCIIPNLILKSSHIMYPLISSSQRYLLEILYGRFKIYKHIGVISEENFNNEELHKLTQIIGGIKKILKLSDGDIIFGDFGIYISTKKPEKFENFLGYYSFIRSLTGVSRDLFFRLVYISSKLEYISDKLKKMDIEEIDKIRAELSSIDKELSVIEIVLGYLEEIINIIHENYPPDFDDFTKTILELIDTDKKISRIRYRLTEIDNLLKSNSELATSLTRLLTTISEDLEREIVKQLAQNTKYQVALGEAMEVLEIGIFGIYALEATHVLIVTSGLEEYFKHFEILNLSLEFWIILISIFIGLYCGIKIIEYKKTKVLNS